MVAGAALGQHVDPPPVPGAGISNTRHDARTWLRSDQVCNICHVPHHGSTEGPLWSHAITTATFTLYGSPSMNASVAQPGMVSKLCLSCHDGTVAINDFVGHTGTATTRIGSGNRNYLGTNLGNDHPVGITYDAALAASDTMLANPAAKIVTIGSAVTRTGTIATTMLTGGKVECTSCHDVHNIYTAGSNGHSLVKVDMAGSSLCLQCHNK
jgi:predicted CXXCH cytochrome family protein